MTDTVTRLLALVEDYAYNKAELTRHEYETWHSRASMVQDLKEVDKARQALHDELVRLFTPLSQSEVVDGFCKQPHDVQFVSVFNAGVRFAENLHGIGGES